MDLPVQTSGGDQWTYGDPHHGRSYGPFSEEQMAHIECQVAETKTQTSPMPPDHILHGTQEADTWAMKMKSLIREQVVLGIIETSGQRFINDANVGGDVGGGGDEDPVEKQKTEKKEARRVAGQSPAEKEEARQPAPAIKPPAEKEKGSDIASASSSAGGDEAIQPPQKKKKKKKKKKLLPGGYRAGDEVFYVAKDYTFRTGFLLVRGAKGEVVKEYSDTKLKVRFPGTEKNTVVLLTELSRTDPEKARHVEPPAEKEGGSDNGASVAGSVVAAGANVGGPPLPDPTLPGPTLPDPTFPGPPLQSPVELPHVEPPAEEERGSDINGASVAGSDGGGGGVSDKDITNVLQDFTPGRQRYGYSHSDVRTIIEKAILAERSKAATSSPAPPSAATSSSVPVNAPGSKSKHAGTEKLACDVCGVRHLTSAGRPRDELLCWNKRNKGEFLGKPGDKATKEKFRKLAEDDPDRYVPFKKQRLG